MDCSHRRRLWVFVITISLVCTVGCGRDGSTSPEPPARVGSSPNTRPDSAGLDSFLRNPPRLTPELRQVVAREWCRQFGNDDALAEFGENLIVVERSLRREGLLLDENERRSVSWQGGRPTLSRGAGAGQDSAARQFETWFVDEAAMRTRPATMRALNAAAQRLAEIRKQLEIEGIGLVLGSVDEERFDELFANVDSIEGIDFFMTKDSAQQLKAAMSDWNSFNTEYERAQKQERPLDEIRKRMRVCHQSLLQSIHASTTTWRELFAAGEPGWEKSAANWDTIDPALVDEIGDRPARLSVLKVAAQRMQESRIDKAAFARLYQEATQIEDSVRCYEQRATFDTQDTAESAGIAGALELAIVALDRLEERRIATELVAAAQSRSDFDAGRLRTVLGNPDVVWSDVTAAGLSIEDDEAQRGTAIPADRLLSPFFKNELRQALDRDAQSNRAAAAAATREYDKLSAKVASLSRQTTASVDGILEGVDEAQQDVETVLDAESNVSTAALRAEIARDLLHDSDAIAERIAAIEAREVLYEPLSDEGRSEILIALERHERRSGDDDEEDEAESSRQKWGERITQAEEAVKAAKDVTELLVTLDVIPLEDANKVLRGLDAASAGLTVATGLMSGNVFDVISGGSQLIAILSGREPSPTIEELRHEQVMEALTALGEGQQVILSNLAVISGQIEALDTRLGDVQRIVLATHRLVVDDQLQGLRLARDFVDARRFYAGERTAALASRPAIPQDYEQWTAHFRKHRHAYVEGRRFLDDQVRETPLEVLQLAVELIERDSSGTPDGLPADWRQRLEQDEERINALRAFSKWIDPAIVNVVLGSLVHPVADQASLERKLALIADRDAHATQVWSAAWSDAALEQSLWRRYNPAQLAEMGHLLAALQPYRLIDQGEDFSGRMPAFTELSAPGFDPSVTFGASVQTRHDQLDRPLRDAERLLMQASAQNALAQGDVLLPLLALLAMSDSIRCDNAEIQHAAERVLVSHEFMRHNALRFLVYLNLHHDQPERERIVAQAVSLLSPEAQEALRPTLIPATTDRAELCERFEQLVQQPLPAMPGWALVGGRLPDDWSMRYLVSAVDRKGYQAWGQTIYGLDLKVVTPMTHEDEEEGAPTNPDRRLGSPAIVAWWYDLHKVKGTKHVWAKRLRLPSGADAQCGRLLETEVSRPLAQSLATVREARLDLARAYSPTSQSAQQQRLAREGWLRALCSALSDSAHEPYRSGAGRTITDAPASGAAAEKR